MMMAAMMVLKSQFHMSFNLLSSTFEFAQYIVPFGLYTRQGEFRKHTRTD